MPFYVSLDLHSDPRVEAAGIEAMGVWTSCGAWSARYKTFGRVPDHVAHVFGPKAYARRLVGAGLWTRQDDDYLFGDLCKFRLAPTRRHIPDELRQQVYARDGYACLHCGTIERLSLDHIHPYSLGGKDTLENLQALCRPCNSSKGARV